MENRVAQQSRFAGWPKINRSWWPEAASSWKFDIIAGLTVWGLVIPESIAYTGLAGVKPVSGIWAIVMVLPFYALFGRSRELIATPTAATAVTAGGLIISLHPKEPANAMGAIAIATGLLFLLAYLFKLGFVVHFISEPINAGFMYGLAIFLTISQLPKMLGFKGGDGNSIEKLWYIVKNIGQTNLTVVALAILAFAILIGVSRYAPKIPAGLLALLVTTVAVGAFSLADNNNVSVVGAIQTGFPKIIDPRWSFTDAWQVIVGSLGIVLLGFSEASSVATEFAEAHGHDYDADDDLFAFGVGNVASGFVGGLVGAGSMSSSSTNVSAGGKTPLSSIVTAAAALVTALFAGGLLANLPEATLGALIVHAIADHLRVRFVGRIGRYSSAEKWIALLAAGGVLMFDVLYGLLIAMGASLLWYLYRTTQVDTQPLGRSKKDPSVLVTEDSPNYEPLPASEAAFRFNGDLFYGNISSACATVVDDVHDARSQAPEQNKIRVVLDLSQQAFLDYTTIRRLRRLFTRLANDCEPITLISKASVAESLTIDGPLPSHVDWVSALDPDPEEATPVDDIDRKARASDDSDRSTS